MKIYKVDAFAETAFMGNPAGVCFINEKQQDDWFLNVAREMNLSETAFLFPRDDGFDLRWFTPAVEVELCGHATLASAHILWERGFLAKGKKARFFTKSGLLTARYENGWIQMDFPAMPEEEIVPPPELVEGLGVVPRYTGRNKFDYLVEVDEEDIVKNIQPDFSLLLKVKMRGVIVTSRAGVTGYDFVSRFFAPAAGIPEDPVTGSAHCCLGPYWQEKMKRNEFLAYQASSRGGFLKIKTEGERVRISGKAITVLEGNLLV